MKHTSPLISLILCFILITATFVIGQETKQNEEDDDWKTFIENVKNDIEHVESKVNTIISNDPKGERTNELLAYISENQDDENTVTSELIVKEIVSKKRGKDLNFKLGKNNKLTKMTLKQEDDEDILSLEVNSKTFNINLETMPDEIQGIEVTDEGVEYVLDNEGKKTVELTDPKTILTIEDNNPKITNYIGLDGEEHELQFLFEGEDGRVKLKEDGIIEFEQSVKIIDKATGTTFSLLSPTGSAGHIQFYKKGHVARPFDGNSIVIEKSDGLIIEVKKSNDNGMFVVADAGITKESYTDFPKNLDSQNTMVINNQEKAIYLAEAEDAIGFLRPHDEYKVFGIPGTPQGGVALNTKKGFGGGKILGDTKKGGAIKPLDTGGRGGGYGGGGGDGGGSGGGGFLNSILPYLLIGGGILLAVLLLSGGDDEDTTQRGGEPANDQGTIGSGTGGANGDLQYNDGQVTTGTAAKPNSSRSGPVIQSPYN